MNSEVKNNMKILQTADIHLGKYGDDRWKTLQKLIEIGKKEKVEIFVISGDLFDKNVDAENLRPIDCHEDGSFDNIM